VPKQGRFGAAAGGCQDRVRSASLAGAFNFFTPYLEQIPMLKPLPLLVVALALLFAAPAQAHSTLASSIPADGSTVSEPKAISLTFTRELRLVTVKLVGNDLDESLAVDRSAPLGKTFSVPLPAVAPGTYKVNWRAAAADGHIMTGSFSFTVAPGGAGKS
jgi:copper resistance protein C